MNDVTLQATPIPLADGVANPKEIGALQGVDDHLSENDSSFSHILGETLVENDDTGMGQQPLIAGEQGNQLPVSGQHLPQIAEHYGESGELDEAEVPVIAINIVEGDDVDPEVSAAITSPVVFPTTSNLTDSVTKVQESVSLALREPANMAIDKNLTANRVQPTLSEAGILPSMAVIADEPSSLQNEQQTSTVSPVAPSTNLVADKVMTQLTNNSLDPSKTIMTTPLSEQAANSRGDSEHSENLFKDLFKQPLNIPLAKNNRQNMFEAAMKLAGNRSSLTSVNGLDNITSSTSLNPVTSPTSSSLISQPVSVSSPVNLSMTSYFQQSGWGQEMGQKVVWMAENNIKGAEIRLNPAQLGPIEIKLSVSQDQANVVFNAHNTAVRDALDLALPRLREMMADQGLTLSNATVSDQSLAKHDHQRHAGESNGGSRGGDDFGRYKQQGEEAESMVNHQLTGLGLVDYYA